MIGALRDARLIISDRGELRFTHESILTGWGRLKEQIAEEQRLFGARERLEQYCRRWVEAPPSPAGDRRRLLLDGFPLAEGRELIAKWGASALSDRQPALPAYIAASDARQKQARRIMQAIAWSVATVFAVLSVLLFNQWQDTLRAQKATEASLLIAQSQSHIRDGNGTAAANEAGRAFKLVPSTASRSALLQALMEISPHLTAVMALGADTGEALAWTSADNLDVARGAGRLRTLDFTKPGQAVGGWDLPVIKRRQDGNRSVVRALSPLGTERIIVIFDEGSVGVYQRETKALQLQAPQRDISVNPTAHAVAVAHSGGLIVLATAEETIILYRCHWDVSPRVSSICEAAPLGEARGRAVAISPDERRIAVGGQTGKVTVYDLSGNPIGSPANFEAPINALGWAEQRDWLAVGTTKGEIAVVEAAAVAKPAVARQTFGDRPVAALAWSPKEPDLAFVCNGSAVCLLRSNAGADIRAPFKPAVRFEGHLNAVTRLNFAPNGARIASGGADGTIRVWSLSQHAEAGFALYADEAAEISTVAISSNRQWVAGGSTDGAIHLWDTKTGTAGRVFKPTDNSEVNDLAWSRNGAVAAIHENDTVNVITTDADQPPVEIRIKTRAGTHLAWTDDRMIAVPMRESGVILLGTQSSGSEPIRIAAGDRKDEAWGVAAIPANHTLLISYISGEITMWDLASKQYVGSMQNTLTGKRARIGVGSLSISRDGRWLATSSGDRFVSIYDIAKRATWRVLETEAPEISTVAFSPDGQKLAALSSDNRLYIWTLRQDVAELYLAVGVIPRRATVGDTANRSEHATWLDWVSNDYVAVATGSAVISVIGVNPAKWLKRIDDLALAGEASIK
jgi:WD40 repeat protein